MITKSEYNVLMEKDNLTNEERSQIEVYRFMTDPPSGYIAYQGKDNRVETLMGDQLGMIVHVISSHRCYKWWLTDRVQYAVVKGINGVYYSAILYGEGTYCRLKAYKD